MPINIRKDKKLKRFLRKVNDGIFSVDTEKFMNDIERIHMTRFSRTLKTSRLLDNTGAGMNSLIRAQNQAQSYRSRLVEIKKTCMRKRMALETEHELVSNYMYNEYAKEFIRRGLKSKGDREAAVAMYTHSAERLFNSLQNVETLADEVIKDIDQAGWSLKHIQEAMSVEKKGYV